MILYKYFLQKDDIQPQYIVAEDLSSAILFLNNEVGVEPHRIIFMSECPVAEPES